MAHNNHITTDSPLSRRIVRAFLHFLNHVEPGPGVDAEGIEVARECLEDAFKVNSSHHVAGDPVKSDSLIDIFKSLESNKQGETSNSGVGPRPDSAAASSSFPAQDHDHGKSHSEASKSVGEDWTQAPHTLAMTKDELCGQFFAALEKNHYFRTNIDGSDDPVQLEKASRLFDDAFMEMEKSGSQQFSLKNLSESLKSLGNKAMQSKLYSDAIELYSCAIALYEKSAVYYCNRAAAYTQVRKYTEAIQDCLRSIEIDPNYSKAYSRLGIAYFDQGNYRDAIDKGLRKALQLDPNNESVKENLRVAEQRLTEGQHRTYHNQHSRSSEEFQNRFAQGSRSHGVPPPFTSMPFNPNDLASMFRNIASNATNAHQGPHPQEREDANTSTGADEPEVRTGGSFSMNFEQIPQDLTGAFQSMMEMFSGTGPPGQPQVPGQPQDPTNGRTAPN